MTKTDYLKKWLLEDLERKAVKIEKHRAWPSGDDYGSIYSTVMEFNRRWNVIAAIEHHRGVCEYTESNTRSLSDIPPEIILIAYDRALQAYLTYGNTDRYDPLRSQRLMIMNLLNQVTEFPTKLPEIPKPARVTNAIEFREPGCRAL